MSASARLRAVLDELARLKARRRELRAERGRAVSDLVTQDGWKRAAVELGGVSRSRVYAIAEEGKS